MFRQKTPWDLTRLAHQVCLHDLVMGGISRAGSRQAIWETIGLGKRTRKKHKLSPSLQFISVAQSCLTLRPHRVQHARLPCPSPTPRACSNSCPSSHWCHPTISSSVVPFSSCLQWLFQWVSYSHQVARVLELQLQLQTFQWIFKTDFL